MTGHENHRELIVELALQPSRGRLAIGRSALQEMSDRLLFHAQRALSAQVIERKIAGYREEPAGRVVRHTVSPILHGSHERGLNDRLHEIEVLRSNGSRERSGQ